MAALVVAITLLAIASAASAKDFTEHDLASEDAMWALYDSRRMRA